MDGVSEPIGGWSKNNDGDRSLSGWVKIIMGDKVMRCPNCKGDLVAKKCRSCNIDWTGSVYDTRYWVCPDCGTGFTGVGEFRLCPACQDKKRQAEQEYWDNKRAGMRSIASDIVARTLAKGN